VRLQGDQARSGRALLPLTQDTGWFFDTELLVLAERAGLRIHEVPVDWIDDLDSRVDIVATALADLRGMVRLGLGFARGTIQVPQLRVPRWRARRGGARSRRLEVSEPAAADRQVRGHRGRQHDRVPGCFTCCCAAVMPAQAANAISLLVTAVANTAANRRLTFGISGGSNAARHQFKGLIAFGIGLALTAGALAVLMRARPIPAAAPRSRSCSPRTWWPPSSGSRCTAPGSSGSAQARAARLPRRTTARSSRCPARSSRSDNRPANSHDTQRERTS
jgi:hypothetical protein